MNKYTGKSTIQAGQCQDSCRLGSCFQWHTLADSGDSGPDAILFWVGRHGGDRRPIPCVSTPARRVPRTGCSVEQMMGRQDLHYLLPSFVVFPEQESVRLSYRQGGSLDELYIRNDDVSIMLLEASRSALESHLVGAMLPFISVISAIA